MIWHYDCPNCHKGLRVDWDDHGLEMPCLYCHKPHYPPTPSEDHLAYIGGDHWPPELEEAVTGLRGTTCDVPGCFRQYDTLALRRSPERGGRLSVANLVPMCNFHTRLKGDQDYDRWLADLTPEQRAGAAPAIEIVFTDDKPASPPGPAGPPPGPAAAPAVVIIDGRTTVVEKHQPEGMHLVTARPVLTGSLSRLVLRYCCLLEHAGACRVLLAAWPRSRPPDWSKGVEKAGTLLAVAVHEGANGSCYEGRLELELAGTTGDELWTVAVFLGNSGGRPEMTDYLLVGRV